MRRVAIIGAHIPELSAGDPAVTAADLIYLASHGAVADSGLARAEIDFTVSGSSDMLEGRSFNFLRGLDAMGAYPPINESHVEMDGAWAVWYAWVKILSGEADTALALSWARATEGSPHHVFNTQLDPLTLAPLGLDHVATAALQADAWMDRTGTNEDALDDVVGRARADARRNSTVARLAVGGPDDDELVASPLRGRHCPVMADGAAAVVLAAEDVAERMCERPVWIAGADHRVEPAALGQRDLSRLPSAAAAMATARGRAGWSVDDGVDVAELTAPFAHQDLMLREALGLDSGTAISPSGGALVADPVIVTGAIRVAEAALQLSGRAGEHQVEGARRAVAHAAAGHALQQNLVWLLEASA